MDEPYWLFSYGTLRQTEVQTSVFGRELMSFEDALPAFRIERLRITDPSVIALSGSDNHPILTPASADEAVHGAALAVNEDDLAKADRYEVSDYARILVTLKSGRRAFVYVHRAVADERGRATP